MTDYYEDWHAEPATDRQVGKILALVHEAHLYRRSAHGWDATDPRLRGVPDEVRTGTGLLKSRLARLTKHQASRLIEALTPAPRPVVEVYHRDAEMVVSGERRAMEAVAVWVQRATGGAPPSLDHHGREAALWLTYDAATTDLSFTAMGRELGLTVVHTDREDYS